MLDEKVLRSVARAHPYPLLFATVSGAHLYGFPSADSDYDLRGAHVLPVRELIGLERPEETLQSSEVRHGVDVDLVTHDVRKFFRLLLRPNGYVLEQLYSPLVVVSTAGHQELLHVARGCITRRHVRHYLGFARNQWSLFEKETPRRVKPLLYVYRVLLTGTHLMRTGEVQANLVRLNEHFRLPYIAELIERKVSGAERATLKGSDVSFHRREFERLYQQLDEAGRDSPLPELPTAAAALDDLLIRLRLGPTSAGGNE
ncbi:MAG TPA: nucleotidyltransferase domain-containing protein [Pseudomonadales bacterium]